MPKLKDKTFNIGSVLLKNNTVAAPLAGVSDWAFRQLARDFGVGLTVTEMISSVGLFQGNEKTKNFTFVNGEHPISVQIFGSDPDIMQYAALYFEDKGADMIDINLGCPVKKVLRQGSGAFLQRNTSATIGVVSKIQERLKIPLTLKLRLGWNQEEENFIEIARAAEDLGVSAITLHPRYATQMFGGSADWSKVSLLKKNIGLPVLGSGDLNSYEIAKSFEAKFLPDFLMFGRGIIGNPFLLSDINHVPPPLSLKACMLQHFDYLVEIYPEHSAAQKFRKFLTKYVRGQSNAAHLRQLGNSILSRRDLVVLTDQIDG
jgi:tRNA-dihydrouridine synthase B